MADYERKESPMPDQSQPKRSVPWAAVGMFAVMAYVGTYLLLSDPLIIPVPVGPHVVYRNFQSPAVACLFKPLTWIEGKVKGKKVFVGPAFKN